MCQLSLVCYESLCTEYFPSHQGVACILLQRGLFHPHDDDVEFFDNGETLFDISVDDSDTDCIQSREEL